LGQTHVVKNRNIGSRSGLAGWTRFAALARGRVSFLEVKTDGFVCSGFWFWFLFWFWQRRCHPKTNETKVGENRARSPEAGTSA
jgi:hypothetical protein